MSIELIRYSICYQNSSVTAKGEQSTTGSNNRANVKRSGNSRTVTKLLLLSDPVSLVEELMQSFSCGWAEIVTGNWLLTQRQTGDATEGAAF